MNTWDIIRSVCEARGAKVHDVLGPRRWSELVKVRKEIAVKLREMGLSYPAIARALCRSHHTSAMYYLGVLRSPEKEHERKVRYATMGNA